ncbi:hypothetical protein P9112_012607 [Eukaryota sp. TZLM1-RC]
MFNLSFLATASLPPVFCILIGVVSAKVNLISETSVPVLTKFIFKLCMTSLLFEKMATLTYSHEMSVFVVCVFLYRVISFAVSLAICCAMKLSGFKVPLRINLYAVFACVTFTNSIVLGVPLVAELLETGDLYNAGDLVIYAMISGSMDYILQLFLSCICLSDDVSLKGIMTAPFKAPPMWGILGGLLLFFLGIPLHPIIDNTLKYLSAAVKGGSHFVCGLVFYQIHHHEEHEAKPINVEESAPLLLDHPPDQGESTRKQTKTKTSDVFSKILDVHNLTIENPLGLGYVFLLFFCKLCIGPFIMWVTSYYIFELDEGQKLLAMFIACLPPSLSAFIIAQNSNKGVAALNRVVTLTTFLLTPLLFMYGHIFKWDF